MSPDSTIFGLNQKRLKEAEEKYALLEPLIDTYLTEGEKKEHRKDVCQKLGVSARTLRRYLRTLTREGVGALARKKRRDAGTLRVFSPEVLRKALSLLSQNPQRSVSMLLKLLEADEQVGERVQRLSPSTLYYHLRKAGYDFKNRGREEGAKSYRKFEAQYPNQLWQGDARHGLLLPHPDNPRKTKMTFLFAWVDDFSRKIMAARYYWDEKLPRMEDCFRRAVLRWGLPDRVYCDNGAVFVSSSFDFMVNSLGVRKIHHPPYCAWCKGKIEAVMKTIKRFQTEAHLAGFKTIEELNQTLQAWVEVEYNDKIHSSTGETPNTRWRNTLGNHHPPRRITDLDHFNSLFLWREERTINKYGQIQFNKNFYKVQGLGIGETVEIRFDPFDLREIQVFHQGHFFCILKASKLVTEALTHMPEEKKNQDISPEAQFYFSKIREKYLERTRKELEDVYYYPLKEEHMKKEKTDEHDRKG